MNKFFISAVILLFSLSTDAQERAKIKDQILSPSTKDIHQPGNNYYIPQIIKLKSGDSKSIMAILSEQFKDLKIMSGEVYFSGAGFSYIERVLFRGPGLEALKTLFARCRPGTEITFFQCRLKGIDGLISQPLNRTVFIK
ncbi:MAG: hypothetical protein ABIY51_14475 [Ferruginibacter sp.]